MTMPQSELKDSLKAILSYSSPDMNAPKPKFRLGWIAILPVAVFLAVEFIYHVPLALRDARKVDYVIGYVFGQCLFGIGGPLLLAWIVWRLARRARIVATTVFCIFVLMLACSQYYGALRDMRAASRTIISAQLAQIRGERSSATAAGRQMLQLGFDPSALKDFAQIQKRLSLLDTVEQNSTQFITDGDQLGQTLARKFHDARLSPRITKRETDVLFKQFNWVVQRKMMADQQELCRAIRSSLLFLADHADDWTAEKILGDIKWRTVNEDRAYMEIRSRIRTALDAVTRDEQSFPAAPAPSRVGQ